MLELRLNEDAPDVLLNREEGDDDEEETSEEDKEERPEDNGDDFSLSLEVEGVPSFKL